MRAVISGSSAQCETMVDHSVAIFERHGAGADSPLHWRLASAAAGGRGTGVRLVDVRAQLLTAAAPACAWSTCERSCSRPRRRRALGRRASAAAHGRGAGVRLVDVRAQLLTAAAPACAWSTCKRSCSRPRRRRAPGQRASAAAHGRGAGVRLVNVQAQLLTAAAPACARSTCKRSCSPPRRRRAPGRRASAEPHRKRATITRLSLVQTSARLPAAGSGWRVGFPFATRFRRPPANDLAPA
jgi:hypothetical protein